MIERLAEHRRVLEMGHLEATQRISQTARASMEDFVDERGQLDLEAAGRKGKLWLVKALEEDRWLKAGQEHVVRKIRLHDALQALSTIMRFHHLLDSLLAARDLPKDERSLDAMIEAELLRVKGQRALAFIDSDKAVGTGGELG